MILAPYRETAQCLHLKRERMSEYLMKWKKWIALALSAVMAVSMLTACGGGGGVTSTLSASRVENQLKEVNADIELTTDSNLNRVVRAGAEKLAETGSQSEARSYITTQMQWDAASQIKNAWNQLIGGLGIITPKVSFGLVQIVGADQLAANQGSGGFAAALGANRSKVTAMAPINTPEKFAATVVLAVDGTVGQISSATNNMVGVSYNVAGHKVRTPDDAEYWIVVAQITVA